MGLTYTDAAAHLFGSSSFTSRDFAIKTGNPRAAKVLSDLKRRGVVERLGRGRYRCLDPAERPDIRATEWNRVRSIVLSGPDPKAWTGETAVEAWTNGRYIVSPSVFSRVYALAVPRDRLTEWRAYLAANGVATRRRKRVGAVVELHPVDRLSAVRLGGEPVIRRHEVERLIAEHPALYGNAKELLIARPSNT